MGAKKRPAAAEDAAAAKKGKVAEVDAAPVDEVAPPAVALEETKPEAVSEATPAAEPAPAEVPASSKAGSLKDVLQPVSSGLAAYSGYEAQQKALCGVAEELMNKWDLLIAGQRHRIVELESYVHSTTHADPYTHGDAGQLITGGWYFHKKGGSFKSGTFKGMDLACGGGLGSGIHAGFLVRAIQETGGRIIEGPCLVVDEILKLNGAASIAAFVASRDVPDLPADSLQELHLEPAVLPRYYKCWTAPRVGLVLRQEEDADPSKPRATHSVGRPVAFCARAYRFSTRPEKLSKFRSGFAAMLRADGADTSQVAKQLSIPAKKLQEYMEAVDKGKLESDPFKFVNKSLNTQPELCEFVGACKSSLQ